MLGNQLPDSSACKGASCHDLPIHAINYTGDCSGLFAAIQKHLVTSWECWIQINNNSVEDRDAEAILDQCHDPSGGVWNNQDEIMWGSTDFDEFEDPFADDDMDRKPIETPLCSPHPSTIGTSSSMAAPSPSTDSPSGS